MSDKIMSAEEWYDRILKRTAGAAHTDRITSLREVAADEIRQAQRQVVETIVSQYTRRDNSDFRDAIHHIRAEIDGMQQPHPKRCWHCREEIVKKNVLGKYVWRHALTESIYCVATAEPED